KRQKQLKDTPCSHRNETRYIPQTEKAKVLERAKGQCEHHNNKGNRCTNTKNLQFEHIKPYATGGSNTHSNLKLYCRSHNLRSAIKFYGKDKILSKIKNKNAGHNAGIKN